MKLRATCVVVGFLSLALSLAAQTASSASASAQVPPLIQFSNVATDEGGNTMSGVVSITFSLYNSQQGGGPLWTETQNNVQFDATGHYSVQLGITKPNGVPTTLFITGEARWLGVRIAEQVEQPRVLLMSVPYALKAGDAATIGGLPPSAFVLAAPPNGSASAYTTGSVTAQNAQPATGTPITGTGTVNFVPLWDTTSDIISSVIFQSGSGTTAKVGINNTTPTSTLDVKGGGTIRGTLSLPSAGVATATKGANSQPVNLMASAFNSSTSKAVNQTFQWQAEPAANDTSSPTGTLNLLFGSGTSKATETGLNIASNGQITFATGQTFPGTGTITGVTTATGSGLAGGGTTGTLSLGLNTCSANQILQYSGTAWTCSNTGTGTITGVTAGTDLTGGGTSGNVTLNLNTANVPLLAAANTFTGNQSVTGNVTATGKVSGSSFLIGSNLFAFGSYTKQNAFLGFGGNSTMTGGGNTAAGYEALYSNTTGYGNVASGSDALSSNTTGSVNTASGAAALAANTTGVNNTASGNAALMYNTTGASNTAVGYFAGQTADHSNLTGSNNTAVGVLAMFGTGSLNNATAIGEAAEVTESNALVLGSIGTSVGIGTTAPAYTLDVRGTGNFTGPVQIGTTSTSGMVNALASSSSLVGISATGYTVAAGSGLSGTDGVEGFGGASDQFAGFVNGGAGVMGVGGASQYQAGLGGLFTGGSFLACQGGTNCGGDGVDAMPGPGADGGIDGFAGVFSGDVDINGTVYTGAKDFKIDHPLDPANRYLFHASVESSEMKNIYDGNLTTDGQGQATVQLPEWFEVLNTDFRYQLTVIGQFAQAIVARKIENNRFEIRTSAPNVEVSWQVTGVRQDAYAKAHPLVVEQEKEARLRGFYIHPELYGAPPEKQIEWARHPQMMKKIKEVHAKQQGAIRAAGQPN